MTVARWVVARVPRAPRWLSREAREFWRLVAPALLGAGVLQPRLDGPALAMLATSWALWRVAAMQAAATREPERAAALFRVAREQAELWFQWVGEFGLPPAGCEALRKAADPAAELVGWLRDAAPHGGNVQPAKCP